MDLKQTLEAQRQEQLNYCRNYLVSLHCNIKSYENSIAFWRRADDDDALAGRMIETLSRLLADSRSELEKYRARIAKLNGFDIVRADLH